MSYNSIFNALGSASDWLLNRFLFPFFDFIESTPLISAAIMITVGLPLVLLVLKSIANFSHSVDTYTVNDKVGFQNSIADVDKKVRKHKKKMLNDKRDEAIKAQRASRGYYSSNNNKYVNAYMNSLKYDKN